MRPRGPALRALPQIRECGGCGLVQRLPELKPEFVARCSRCDAMLGRKFANPPIATPLAFCLTSLTLYLVCVTQPLMTLSIFGRMRTVNLFTGPIQLIRDGWVLPGLVVGAVTTLLPAIEILLMLGILLGALHHRLPWRVPHMMRWYDRLRPWSMVEVYLLGVLVAYTKMIDLADVSVGPAVYALFALMLTMAATDTTLDDDVIWSRRRVRLAHPCPNRGGDVDEHGRRIDPGTASLPPSEHLVSCRSCGLVCCSETALDAERCLGSCPRCGSHLHRRKPDSVRRATIFVFSAIIFYIPANLFPVMTIIKLHRGGGHTILEGVGELYDANMLPLALLVFFASITVPVLKILSLSLMCFATWEGSNRRLVGRTKLFRVVVFIGRWSMIDVFMISILVAMVQFGALADVHADGGMLAFASVVILTILGADCFDPRVMWDAAGENGPALAMNAARSRARQAEPARA